MVPWYNVTCIIHYCFNREHPDLARLAVIYIKLHKFYMINLLLGEMRNGLG